MDLSFDKLKAKYLTLPDELRDAISSADAADALYAIGEANNLRVDEMDALSKQTGLVLLGFMHPNDYVAQLRTALPMSRDKATAIAQAVNEKIFMPVHDSIVAMHKQGATPPAPAPQATATSIPHTLGADMAQMKMAGAHRLEPDSVTVKAPKPMPTAPVRNGVYASADPYREPIS